MQILRSRAPFRRAHTLLCGCQFCCRRARSHQKSLNELAVWCKLKSARIGNAFRKVERKATGRLLFCNIDWQELIMKFAYLINLQFLSPDGNNSSIRHLSCWEKFSEFSNYFKMKQIPEKNSFDIALGFIASFIKVNSWDKDTIKFAFDLRLDQNTFSHISDYLFLSLLVSPVLLWVRVRSSLCRLGAVNTYLDVP